MAKKPKTDPHAAGSAVLARHGITAESVGAGAIAADRLADLLRSGGAGGVALARLLGDVPRPEHAALLAAADEESHGVLRREIRRALFRLRQGGIEAPPPPRAAPAGTRAPAGEEIEGWCSPVDGRGDQLVWMTKRVPGGLVFLQARINDVEGVCDLGAHELSRKQFRAQREELRDRHGLRMVGVDWRRIDRLLSDAPRSATASGPPYAALRRSITQDPAPAPPPAPDGNTLVHGELPREAIEPDPVAASAELLEHEELRRWMPPPQTLEPYAQEILEAHSSPLVLNRHQQEERVAAVLRRATGELFPADRFAGRLDATAYYLWKTGRERPARVAVATADALRGGIAAIEVPLLAALAQRGISVVYEALKRRAELQEKESLIVKPGQPQDPGAAARRPAAPATRKSSTPR
jgi:hypothetical protein